ncbi:MAG: 5-formyltetrahydrofolate cyclo-ligase [Parachlamydia sp.]|nr:5-formyltetrahydrofolate cyclo-ligase [Parachlamydia sp.]
MIHRDDKSRLRRHFKSLRASLPSRRRQEASAKALAFIKHQPPGLVLSYASFQHELDTSAINAWLAAQGRLVLPKVQGDNLALYQVSNPCRQLETGVFGISEPLPSLCRAVASEEISFVLVPGLAFDAAHQRLGYGGGYYDRYLAKRAGRACGMGFREQLVAQNLPVLASDVSLDAVMLF